MDKNKKVEFSFGYLIKDYPKHRSDLYEIHYTLRGKGKLVGKNFSYDLLPDTLTISPPMEEHFIEVQENIAFHVIKIMHYGDEKSLLDQICSKCRDANGFTLSKSRRFEFERLRALSFIPGHEADNYAWYGLISILGELQLSTQMKGTTESYDILVDMVRFLDNNLDKKLKMDDISSFFNMTPTKINKMFKERVGLSAMDYFQSIKIDSACYLLKTSDYVNKELAAQLGYSDEFHFSKAFKKKTGMSPKEYRVKVNKNLV